MYDLSIFNDFFKIRQKNFYKYIPKNAKAGQNRIAKRGFVPANGPESTKVFSDGTVYMVIDHKGWRKIKDGR